MSNISVLIYYLTFFFPGLPGNELVAGEKSNKQQLTASVTTAKTTLAHSAVVKARDEAYQVSRIPIGVPFLRENLFILENLYD